MAVQPVAPAIREKVSVRPESPREGESSERLLTRSAPACSVAKMPQPAYGVRGRKVVAAAVNDAPKPQVAAASTRTFRRCDEQIAREDGLPSSHCPFVHPNLVGVGEKGTKSSRRRLVRPGGEVAEESYPGQVAVDLTGPADGMALEKGHDSGAYILGQGVDFSRECRECVERIFGRCDRAVVWGQRIAIALLCEMSGRQVDLAGSGVDPVVGDTTVRA
jgi:phenylpropionate dioxygenase-like ring-hydroxylating dioxygenase large terminal subunit